jgi:hypothetical protein
MSDPVHMLKQAAEGQVLANPALVKALLAGGGGLLAGGALGVGLEHMHDQAAKERARNTAFGAGVATGMAGPQIIDALHSITHRSMP